MRPELWITIATLSLAALAQADSIILKNGTRLEGELKRVDGGWEVALPGGESRFVAQEEVKSVELTQAAQLSEDVARERLESLRRSVRAEKSIERIIHRYELFVTTSTNTQAGVDAQTDLQIWRDRLANHYVRLGREWMTAQDRLAAIREMIAGIEAIQALAAQDRFADMQALIDERLEKNPDDVSFIYLDGVLKYRQGEFGAARKAFETVARSARTHAPTLNNLAAAHFGLGRESSAISPLDRALQAAPGVQVLIDNTAELLHALDPTPPRNSPTDRLLQRFAQQDRHLQEQMRPQGLFRWGSNWVDEKTITELRTMQKEIESKLSELDARRSQSLSRQQQISDMIKFNLNAMRRIEVDSVYIDAQGRVIRVPLPNAYYEYQRDNIKLKVELDGERRAVAEMDQQAKQLKDSYPVPQFRGELKIIGEEGVPLVLPSDMSAGDIFPAPTTEPSDSGLQGLTVIPDEGEVAEEVVEDGSPTTSPTTQPD